MNCIKENDILLNLIIVLIKLYRQEQKLNIDALIERKVDKKYRDKNNIKINEKKKIYRNEHKEESKEYYENNKVVICERMKIYRNKNIENIHALKNVKYECPCGGKYTHCHKA